MTAQDQIGELAHDPLADSRLALLAVEGDQVATQEHPALQMRLQRAQHRVLTACQLGGNVVRQLDLGPHPPFRARGARRVEGFILRAPP